jgi:hypothetical protein
VALTQCMGSGHSSAHPLQVGLWYLPSSMLHTQWTLNDTGGHLWLRVDVQWGACPVDRAKMYTDFMNT